MKRTPEDMLKFVDNYQKNLEAAKESHVVVGLPKDKVGGKVYGKDGMSILRIGAIHEFGATFMHPGGTPYLLGIKGGKFGVDGAKFIPKERNTLGQFPVTKPHPITIPRRSFLRATWAIKKRDTVKAIETEFRNVGRGMKARQALGRLGVELRNLVVGAFTTNGYGQWKRSKKDGQTLVDTGTLRNSITWQVRENANA